MQYSDLQYGFLENTSTEDAIARLIIVIKNSVDIRTATMCIFIDLTMLKHFETVNNKELLSYLENIGFRGIVLKLLRSDLHQRYQSVKIENVSSEMRTMEYAIPQITILGSLFFIHHFNYLFQLEIESQTINSQVILQYSIKQTTS